MRVTISTDDPRPIYLQIGDEIRRALVVGSLRPDEALPSVRRLATDLRVNPNTVAQAYQALEADGIVYRRRGTGTFASPTIELDGAQRRALAGKVARRAQLDAHRNGVSVDELISALQVEAAAKDPDENAQSPPRKPSKKRATG